MAALLFIRALSTNVEGVILAATNHELGVWSLNLSVGYGELLLMAVPMLVIIVATANLGPPHGPKRIAALGVAVILSAGVGSLLRVIFVGWVWSWADAFNMLLYVWPRYAILGGMLTVVGEFYLPALQQWDGRSAQSPLYDKRSNLRSNGCGRVALRGRWEYEGVRVRTAVISAKVNRSYP